MPRVHHAVDDRVVDDKPRRDRLVNRRLDVPRNNRDAVDLVDCASAPRVRPELNDPVSAFLRTVRTVDRDGANGCATPSTATSHAYARRTGGNVYATTCA